MKWIAWLRDSLVEYIKSLSFYFHLGNSDANDPADMNESDNLSEHFHDAPSSPTNNKQENPEVSTGNK